MSGVFLDCVPQPADVHIQGACIPRVFGFPYLFEELLSLQDLSWMRH
jgi:hypothetical protein